MVDKSTNSLGPVEDSQLIFSLKLKIQDGRQKFISDFGDVLQ